MAVIKCKMCGGDLNLIECKSIAECEYCGSIQTVPVADNEKKLSLFARANRLRAACEFDKAAGVYESIVADFPEEAEAYWGMVLCKYGIEYVDDPATGKKVPTCHRSSFDNILKDESFELAQENADVMARKVMREEAKQIEDIRRGIIAVSNNEEPYDIFICYKETGFDGKRSLDSVLAQDIYDALTDKGYRVFFSRVTLEDKLGQEYEPYIFAALNSAKIMLVVGTDYEYFNAVWVKNEWSRYLKLMAQDKEKHLIPCYKGIDAYDMPEEFARLQAQDLDKMGAIQDILRGVEKLLPRQDQATPAPQTAPSQWSVAANYVKRGNLAIESHSWDAARNFFEAALNQDAECAQAYLGLALCDEQVDTSEALIRAGKTKNQNYLLAKRFSPEQQAILEQLEESICQPAYEDAIAAMTAADSERAFKAATQRFWNLGGYKDSEQLAEQCLQNAKVKKYHSDYTAAVATMAAADSEQTYKQAAQQFLNLDGYQDSAELAEQCLKKAETDRIYAIAKLMMINRACAASSRLRAVETLESISGWKDAGELAAKYRGALEQEAKQVAFNNKQKEEKRQRLQEELRKLEEERNNLRGLFNGVRRREIDDRIQAIKYELVALE